MEPGEEPAGWGAGRRVIPGYTGFTPRAQHLCAKTDREICKEARSQRRIVATELPSAGRPPPRTQQEHKDQQARPARSPHSAPPCPPARPRTRLPATGSPYPMDSDPTCFISGFTGFVPRARLLIGAGYPLTTHCALAEIGQTARRGSRPEAGQGSALLPPLLRSYPTARGLLPHYAGYTPGYKFQFGHTYGQLTHNALGQSCHVTGF